MDNTKTKYTPQQVQTMVDDMMKDFDISKLQGIGYENIQKVAKEYIKSEDPEIHAVGQELKNIDPTIFELTQAESRVDEIHKTLTDKGKKKAEADMFGIQLLQLASESTMRQITSAMNEKSLNEWEALQAHSPNIIQQMYLLDQTSQMLLKKSFDDLYEESLNKAVDLALSILTEGEKSADLVKTLTKEQSETVMTAFNANQYEIAIQLIYGYVEENEG